MTESEVLKIFENEVIILDCWIEHCKDIIADCETEEDEFDDDKERAELSLRDYTERKEAFDVAISALKEIHLYKNNKLCLVPEDVYSRQCSELDAYKEIGTVEECREAMANKKKCEKQWHNDMENPLEPIKVYSALKSEILKLELRIKNRPKDISILDYTVIAALQKVLKNNLEGMEDENT